jgi:hypothetical protein
MPLSEQEDKIINKAYALGIAVGRYNRYCLHRGNADFEQSEATERFKIMIVMLKDLKNYCVNCGSDN